jgi:hypothetical protein
LTDAAVVVANWRHCGGGHVLNGRKRPNPAKMWENFHNFSVLMLKNLLALSAQKCIFFRTGQPAGTTEADLGLTELMPFDELL